MDSEFPPDLNYAPMPALKPELLPIDRIVLFADHRGAEAFLQNVFPHFTNCLVASADRTYPQDPGLKAALFPALAENAKIRVAVFQVAALKEISLKSERIFVMDEILMQDFKRHPADRAVSLGFTPQRVAFLLDSFFGQWDKMERIGNASFAYSNFREFHRDRFDWRAALLGISDQEN